MAWLHANLHGIKRDKLVETAARLGLLQIIDPFPGGLVDALTSWNDHSGSREEYEKITGITAEDAPTAARIPGYYQILQDIGYQPADDETSHLDQLIAAITEADQDEENDQ